MNRMVSVRVSLAVLSIRTLIASFYGVVFASGARIWGECWTIHSQPALFFFFFFKVEISFRTVIPLFTPGLVHSGSAS